jgi:general secretion pathway protein A
LYPKYFGLKEASFSITPDPQYLFLSEQHREALAHLLYGAGEGGGFVLLTGEVGTGKTTVCRAFLEQLPPEVDVALILNPAVSAIELLRTICDEFRIHLEEGEHSSKQLLDRINAFLLRAHANGRRPVLMIDEAQNLRPKVLEQIRLLTNLETPKQKLLQIFLVGQPELRVLLGRQGLRQLDQRITARFHLKPLDARETGDYIRHRLAVGGVQRPLFTAAAIRRIHALSGGVPRLVNILCDRALLGAYVSHNAQVTPSIVDKSAREVQGEATLVTPAPRSRRVLIAAALTVALAGGWWVRGWLEAGGTARIAAVSARWLPSALLAPAARQTVAPPNAAPAPPANAEKRPERPAEALAVAPGGLHPSAAGPGPLTADEGAAPVGAAAVAEVPSAQPPAKPPDGTASISAADPAAPPAGLPVAPAVGVASVVAPPQAQGVPPAGQVAPADLRDLALGETEAMRMLLSLWGVNLKDLGPGDPCDRLPAYGLRCERDRGTWRQLQALDTPALLRVRPGRGQGRDATYLVLSGLGENSITLVHPNGSYTVSRADLKQLLSGSYTLVWQLPPVGAASIGAGSQGEAVRWLRKLLSQVPELGVTDTESGVFDAAVGSAVRRFQATQGLNPDGIAGPKTLIQLNNAVGMPGIPKLSKGP